MIPQSQRGAPSLVLGSSPPSPWKLISRACCVYSVGLDTSGKKGLFISFYQYFPKAKAGVCGIKRNYKGRG